MTTWLTLYYTLSLLILLAAASAVLYLGLRHSMLQEDAEFLAHKVQVLTVLLQQPSFDRAAIEQEVLKEAEISGQSPTPYLLRVLDRSGRVIVETPGMGAAVPASAFPSDGAGSRVSRPWSSGAARLLLASATVPMAHTRQLGWHIQAALNISAQEHLLAGYRQDIGIVLLGGLVLAAIAGGWITRRGLRPIVHITRATERIGAQQLQERIEAGPWPRELIALASAFDRMLDRLQEAFERLSQFSADLAHELRTPINNLVGEAQVILSRPRTAAEYERVLHSALEEYGRLARMIDSMLFLAQADQSRSALELVARDARREMQAVADFYQAVADEQNVTLTCEGELRLTADPLLLRRALSNLLSNALKHTPGGGRITLQALESEHGPTVRVIDSGVGIPAEHLSSLGERFYRVDPARSAAEGGAGLGLAIVKSIMALHGGKLQIESSPGRGTVASLIFPAEPPQVRPAA
jgi:two-component system, OmpR family, heavy metal sensor histidine kinase CusS